MDIAQARERLRIPKLWQHFNLLGQPKTSCGSPFREDRRPSSSVSSDGLMFHDFATGEAGDAGRMSASVEEKRAPAKRALCIVRLLAVYHLHAAGAKLFERPFWFFEQRRSSLRDRIDNERSAR